MEKELKIDLSKPYAMACFHPVTLEEKHFRKAHYCFA